MGCDTGCEDRLHDDEGHTTPIPPEEDGVADEAPIIQATSPDDINFRVTDVNDEGAPVKPAGGRYYCGRKDLDIPGSKDRECIAAPKPWDENAQCASCCRYQVASSAVDLVLTAAIFRDLAADHEGPSAAARTCNDHNRAGETSRDELWRGLSDSGLTDRQIEHLFFHLDTEEYSKVRYRHSARG